MTWWFDSCSNWLLPPMYVCSAVWFDYGPIVIITISAGERVQTAINSGHFFNSIFINNKFAAIIAIISRSSSGSCVTITINSNNIWVWTITTLLYHTRWPFGYWWSFTRSRISSHHVQRSMLIWHADSLPLLLRWCNQTTWLQPHLLQQSPVCALPLYAPYGTRACDLVVITHGDIMGVIVRHKKHNDKLDAVNLLLFSIVTNQWLPSPRGGTTIIFDGFHLCMATIAGREEFSDGTGYHHVHHHHRH